MPVPSFNTHHCTHMLVLCCVLSVWYSECILWSFALLMNRVSSWDFSCSALWDAQWEPGKLKFKKIPCFHPLNCHSSFLGEQLIAFGQHKTQQNCCRYAGNCKYKRLLELNFFAQSCINSDLHSICCIMDQVMWQQHEELQRQRRWDEEEEDDTNQLKCE